MSTSTSASGLLDRSLDPRRFAVVLLLLSAAIGLWYVPYGLPTPDAGGALVNASKILRGAVFYRDIDYYPFPAAAYLVAAVMHLFGETLAVTRVLAAVIYAGIVMAGYAITLHLAGRGAAALCGLSLLALRFFALPAFLDAQHPELSLCLALWAAVAFLRFQDSGRHGALLATGLLTALTLLSKQNLGLYLGAAIGALLLLDSGVRRQRSRASRIFLDTGTFAIGALAPVAAAALYFHHHGVLGRMLYSGLVRPFSGYMATSGLPFGVPFQWWNFGDLQGQAGFAYSVGPLFQMLTMQKLPLLSWYPAFWAAEEALVRSLYLLVPLVFVLSFWCVWRLHGRVAEVRSIACLAVLALAVLASAFPRADFYHVASVYPAILVLAFVVGSRLVGEIGRPRLASAVRVAASGATLAAFFGSLLLAGWYFHTLTYEAGNDRGRVMIPPENAWIDDVVNYLDANLDGNDGLFVYGHEAYYYFFSGRFAAWPFPQLYPGMTGDDDGKALADSLRSSPPSILLKGLIGGWPGLANVNDYTGEMKTFIATNYQPTTKPFRDGRGPDAPPPPGWLFEVMERR